MCSYFTVWSCSEKRYIIVTSEGSAKDLDTRQLFRVYVKDIALIQFTINELLAFIL